MFYCTYILYSLKDKRLYVGCTKDLEKRIQRHIAGYVLATKHRKPLVLIYKKQYSDKSEAFQRERFLKSLWGAREKKQILKKYLDRAKA